MFRPFLVHNPLRQEGIALQRIKAGINGMLNNDWTEPKIKRWKKLREYVLIHPTASQEEADGDFIIKNYYAYNMDPAKYLFYYRDIDKKEIDLVFVDGVNIYPVEIKKNEAPAKPTKNFAVLEKYKMNIMPGLVIDTCDKIRAVNERAYTFPVYLL